MPIKINHKTADQFRREMSDIKLDLKDPVDVKAYQKMEEMLYAYEACEQKVIQLESDIDEECGHK